VRHDRCHESGDDAEDAAKEQQWGSAGKERDRETVASEEVVALGLLRTLRRVLDPLQPCELGKSA
jgi:hypothetical protein